MTDREANIVIAVLFVIGSVCFLVGNVIWLARSLRA